MVERVNIAGNRIVLKNSSNIVVFDTTRNYIKQDPTGTLKAGGYQTVPSIYGYTSANINDKGRGGLWATFMVEDPDYRGPYMYSGYRFSDDGLIVRAARGTNMQYFLTDYTNGVPGAQTWNHPITQCEMYNRDIYGDQWVPAFDAFDVPIRYRWCVSEGAYGYYTGSQEKLWPEFISSITQPIRYVTVKHSCRLRFKYSDMDQNSWGTRIAAGSGIYIPQFQTYAQYYGATPVDRYTNAGRWGLRTFGLMNEASPISLSAVVTV